MLLMLLVDVSSWCPLLPPAGVWGVGLATSSVRLDSLPLGNDQLSWVLTSDGTTLHNNEVISILKEKPTEEDILVKVYIQ